MSKASVSKIKNQTYTGKEITPQLTVKYKGKLLAEGTDYKVSYENNKEIGTAAAVVTGIGGYSGEKRINFKIVGTSIAKARLNNPFPSFFIFFLLRSKNTLSLNKMYFFLIICYIIFLFFSAVNSPTEQPPLNQ